MNLFDISSLEKQLSELEKETMQDGFWNDSKKSGTVLQKIKTIKNKIDIFNKLNVELNNLMEMSELVIMENESNDTASNSNQESEQNNSLVKDILDGTKTLQTELDNLEVETLLSGKYDINNAIVTIHPGAGGTESQDWAEMLYRMYTRWANANNYSVQELDYLDGDEAGLKSVTFLISGDYAYGYMKAEKGVHRLVRISPFDAGGRRHTSFASVDIMPYIEDNIERQGIHSAEGHIVVQGIALQQRQHQIHTRAAQSADNHDQKGFPVFPDIGNEPGNAKEGQGCLLFFFFHIHGRFHQAVSSSLLMLWI